MQARQEESLFYSNSDNGGEKGSDSRLLSEIQKMKEKRVLEKISMHF